ncbi:unnamed protein product [Rotaria socialis]|uniref:Uncharacterized protein n=1 Tax=Rotaria socialis TaxID=392032 RepID=A0A820VKJ5_9BILA|nr:unnamed protein product [Rotaria socialis]
MYILLSINRVAVSSNKRQKYGRIRQQKTIVYDRRTHDRLRPSYTDSLHRRLVSEGLAIAYRDEEKVQGLANICALSSQYRGMEYPCANIDMQDRLISLVNAGIPDGKSELELKNNGFKSGRVYKLIQKEQQQLLNVVENSEFFQQKKEIDHILYKALQPLKVGGKILGALRV